jgi:hypothetical protein
MSNTVEASPSLRSVSSIHNPFALVKKHDAAIQQKKQQQQLSSSSKCPPALQLHDVGEEDDDRWRTWYLTSIPPIPMYYALERSAISIPNDDQLAFRISSFLRLNSITATYHDHYVECTTPCRVQFVIQLWQQGGPTPNHDDDDDDAVVVVEIQRRRGCPIRMRFIRQMLLQAIVHTTKDKQHITFTTPTLTSAAAAAAAWPCTQRLPTKTWGTPGAQQQHDSCCTKNALQIVQRLLESACTDQQVLGMESLLVLSKRPLVAKQLCNCREMSQLFGTYFQQTERGGEPAGPSYCRSPHFGTLHNLALQVLDNVLQVAVVPEEEMDEIMDSLLYNLQAAHRRPQEAAVSVRCLWLLQRDDPIWLPWLMDAMAFGQAHHLMLEQETQRLLGRILSTYTQTRKTP